jgi:hypothetical protein
MPIMAAHAQSDARGAAWLLASTAKQYLSERGDAASTRGALNNVYRLLEAYRSKVIFSPTRPVSQTGVDSADLLTLLPTTEGHLEDVRDALEQALTSTFSSESKSAALEFIEGVLRAAAYPERFEEPAPEKRAKVVNFFEELVRHLHIG